MGIKNEIFQLLLTELSRVIPVKFLKKKKIKKEFIEIYNMFNFEEEIVNFVDYCCNSGEKCLYEYMDAYRMIDILYGNEIFGNIYIENLREIVFESMDKLYEYSHS
jgi:hypothetical protein